MTDPITSIVESIAFIQSNGYKPTIVKLRESTLAWIFHSEEAKDLTNKYAPTADTLAKVINGIAKTNVRVVLDESCEPDRVHVS